MSYMTITERQARRLVSCLGAWVTAMAESERVDFAQLQAIGLVELATPRGMSDYVKRYRCTDAGRRWLLGPHQ